MFCRSYTGILVEHGRQGYGCCAPGMSLHDAMCLNTYAFANQADCMHTCEQSRQGALDDHIVLAMCAGAS